jgi:hypothetical protein
MPDTPSSSPAAQRANEAVLEFLDDVDRGIPIKRIRDA